MGSYKYSSYECLPHDTVKLLLLDHLYQLSIGKECEDWLEGIKEE